MAQWQDCRHECWEAWVPVFNPRPGFGTSINRGNHREHSFPTLYCLSPYEMERLLEEFHIHFISSFILSVSSAYTKKHSLYV